MATSPNTDALLNSGEVVFTSHGQFTLSKHALKETIKSIGIFCNREIDFQPEVYDETAALNTVAQFSSQGKAAIHNLTDHIISNKDDSAEVQQLITNFQEKMKLALEKIGEIKKYNRELVTKIGLASKLSDLAKKSDLIALRNFIVKYNNHLKCEDIDLALRNAAAAGQTNNIDILLQKGALLLSEGTSSKRIALHQAIIGKHPACIRKLLNSVDKYVVCRPNPVRQLLQADSSGKTPLDYIDSISDVKIKKKIITSILDALDTIEKSSSETSDARKLIKDRLMEMRGVDIDEKHPTDVINPAKTSRFFTVTSSSTHAPNSSHQVTNHTPTLEQLQQKYKKAEECELPSTNLTLRRAAAMGDWVDIGHLLDVYDANIHSKSSNTFTALDWAYFNSHMEAVNTLCWFRADQSLLKSLLFKYVTETESEWPTKNIALCRAAIKGNCDDIKILIGRYKANPHFINAEGKTPLTLANEANQASAFEMIKNLIELQQGSDSTISSSIKMATLSRN